MLDIGYCSFYEDCNEIFTPFLAKFGFFEIEQMGQYDDYTRHYRSEYWVLEISMLSNFPRVGVGFVFCSLELEETRPSKIEEMLAVDQAKMRELYKKYSAEHELNDFRTQMFFVTEIMSMFYQEVLTGTITFKGYQKFIAGNESSKT